MSGMWAVSTCLNLPGPLHAALLAHAAATPTLEVCGLLGGRDACASSLYRIPNEDPSPATAFEMAPQAMLAAFQTMRARNEELVGIYHSHPQSPPRPSARDLAAAAYPGVAYLVVSLLPPAPALGAFLFDGEAFRAIALTVTPGVKGAHAPPISG